LIAFRLHGKGVPAELATFEVEAEGESIRDLMANVMEGRNGLREFLTEGGELRTDITILVNGRHCMFMEGLDTKLSQGDQIDILLPMIGG
jgi:molybdopterin synthase sulfur carrier subunit